MERTDLPLPPEIWATTPGAAQTLIVAQRERIRDLEARLGQHAANSSRPPSSDPPQAPAKRRARPSGRKRGGPLGHRGAFRALRPVEQVDEIVAVVPARCRHGEQPFPEPAPRRRARVWRHQVVELLPLAVPVTEYQMTVRRCALWHRFRAGEFGREELRRLLIPLQARLGRLLSRGQEHSDRKPRGCAGS